LLKHTGLADDADLPYQMDRSQWPAMKERLTAIFKTRTRDEWCELLESDPELCFAPVLSMAEAHEHPHNQARETFVEVAGVVQPAPAPRLSRTPGAISRPPSHAGQHTDEALAEWGFAPDEIVKLREAGAVK
jgi:alpha-methylacyl-CoA racemase